MPLYNPVLNFVVASDHAGTCTRTTVVVPANIANATELVAANANRKGLSLLNNSTGNVLIEFGAAPTATSYLVKLNSGGYYEVPYDYTGQIQGLWDAAGGTGVLVREFS